MVFKSVSTDCIVSCDLKSNSIFDRVLMLGGFSKWDYPSLNYPTVYYYETVAWFMLFCPDAHDVLVVCRVEDSESAVTVLRLCKCMYDTIDILSWHLYQLTQLYCLFFYFFFFLGCILSLLPPKCHFKQNKCHYIVNTSGFFGEKTPNKTLKNQIKTHSKVCVLVFNLTAVALRWQNVKIIFTGFRLRLSV